MAKKSDKNKAVAVAEKPKRILGNKSLADVCLPFEKSIVDLERKIEDLRQSNNGGVDLSGEIKSVEKKLEKAIKDVFDKLTPWQRVQVARHPLRPYTLDYISAITTDFIEIHGDRRFSDDPAMVCGFGKLDGVDPICIIGHQKGRDTKENVLRSFGSAHPEGYRKAMRVMLLAQKRRIPIVCLVDTPGAFPGIGAEERGQAEAIAHNLREMADVDVPIIVIVIGEGGSGGALGIGIGDIVGVLENAYYSVISPEGCAAILWKEASRAEDAAEALKLTGKELLKLGIIDAVVPEPLGGAHRDFDEMALNLKAFIKKSLATLSPKNPTVLLEERYQKFRVMGCFKEK